MPGKLLRVLVTTAVLALASYLPASLLFESPVVAALAALGALVVYAALAIGVREMLDRRQRRRDRERARDRPR